jgi:hypothetical protein
MILSIFQDTPIRIWVFFILLLWLGYKATFTRVRNFVQLAVVPLVFIYMESDAIHHIFEVNFIDVFYSLFGIVVGFIIGILLVKNKKIKSNKETCSVRLPGEYYTLLIIFVNIVLQYTVHALDYFHVMILYKMASYILTVMGVFSGISIGRFVTYVYKYKHSKHTNFKSGMF